MENIVHLGLGWIGEHAGGLERYQHGICSAHTKLGVNVEAWVQSRGSIANDVPYSITVYASPRDARSKRIGQLKRLAISRFKKQDLTFVSHHASVSASLVPYLKDIPHIVHFHGPWSEEAKVEGASWWKVWLQRRMEERAYSSADRIITLSAAFAKIVVERYRVPAEIVRVIPGAIDSRKADPGITRAEARERLGWPTDRPIVVCIRRLVRRVGVDVLIDAVGLLRAKHPDLLVLIGGTGPLAGELNTKIDAYGLRDQVRLLGFVPDKDLPIAYAAADYSIVPTQSLEGFGLVTIESMAAGTPAIVTPVGSLPEIISPLCKNLITPGNNANAIAEGLSTILRGVHSIPSDDDCRHYVRVRYDWETVAKRVLAVFGEAIGKRV